METADRPLSRAGDRSWIARAYFEEPPPLGLAAVGAPGTAVTPEFGDPLALALAPVTVEPVGVAAAGDVAAVDPVVE